MVIMSRHEYSTRTIPQMRLEKYFKQKNVNCTIKNNNFLIPGMMRGAAKTYSVFEFLLKDLSVDDFKGVKIFYVTRVVGDVKEEGNRGTFYDTENTIRKIEKQLPKKNSVLKICMIAGVEKICKKQVEINKSKDKYREL